MQPKHSSLNENHHHTVAETAAQCRVSTKRLYNLLREEAWLHTGRRGDFRDYIHNTPKRWAEKVGLIFGEQIKYKKKGTEIERWETRPLITPLGARTLKGFFIEGKALPSEPSKPIKPAFNTTVQKLKPANNEKANVSLKRIKDFLND
ncbi:hypothetical protein [Teredinibacter purpureus]|uniref:hypothetical protein n=1 Tax=Teredinibacter purpureus TaxID=2731756 RepID=UPI0005F7B7DC|nr:hypothetical protein [Teredinibacter purpureus]